MSVVTLADLIVRVRDRADATYSTFVTDTEITRYLNESWRALYDIIIARSWGQDYFSTVDTFVTVAGTDLYYVPTDFYRLLGLDAAIGGSIGSVTLERFPFKERTSDTSSWSCATLPRYRFRAKQIWFVPAPDGVYTITIHYIPEPTDLSGAVSLSCPNAWWEWVVLDSAIKCVVKEEGDPAALGALRASVQERVERMAPYLDAGEPSRIAYSGVTRMRRGNDL